MSDSHCLVIGPSLLFYWEYFPSKNLIGNSIGCKFGGPLIASSLDLSWRHSRQNLTTLLACLPQFLQLRSLQLPRAATNAPYWPRMKDREDWGTRNGEQNDDKLKCQFLEITGVRTPP